MKKSRRTLMSTLQSSPFSPTVFASLPASGIRSGHSFPSSLFPFAATVFPCRHIVPSPCRRDGSAPLGECSRQNVAVPRHAQRRVQTLIRFGWPTVVGLVTTMPDSGGATFREAGPIWMNGAAVCGEPCPCTVTHLARVPRKPRRAARVS